MGKKAERDSGISRFVAELLEKEGIALYEKWFAHLQQAAPGQKISDPEVRDQMLDEIVSLAAHRNHLILDKKDKTLIEELVNRFLSNARLL